MWSLASRVGRNESKPYYRPLKKTEKAINNQTQTKFSLEIGRILDRSLKIILASERNLATQEDAQAAFKLTVL